MRKICDGCKKPVKKVGKLFKVGYLMLCKSCRKEYKRKQRPQTKQRIKNFFRFFKGKIKK